MPTIKDVSIIDSNKAKAVPVKSGLERTICSPSLCGSKNLTVYRRTILKGLQLISAKPVLYVCNVDERAAAQGNAQSARVAQYARQQGAAANDHDGPHHQCSNDPPEEDAVLIDRRDFEEGHEDDEEEDVVGREGEFDDVAGEEHEDGFGSGIGVEAVPVVAGGCADGGVASDGSWLRIARSSVCISGPGSMPSSSPSNACVVR